MQIILNKMHNTLAVAIVASIMTMAPTVLGAQDITSATITGKVGERIFPMR